MELDGYNIDHIIYCVCVCVIVFPVYCTFYTVCTINERIVLAFIA